MRSSAVQDAWCALAAKGDLRGAGDNLVHDYARKRGLGVTREQIDRLVPAFEATWAAIDKQGAARSASARAALRDRVAKAVVNQVITRGISDPEKVREAVLREVLPASSGRGGNGSAR
jgi:hypothetical protein